jgi:hypothetical protein
MRQGRVNFSGNIQKILENKKWSKNFQNRKKGKRREIKKRLKVGKNKSY